MGSKSFIISVAVFFAIMALVTTSWIMHSTSRTETTMRAPPTPSNEVIEKMAQDAYRKSNPVDGNEWTIADCAWGHGMMPWTIDVWFRMESPSRYPNDDPTPRKSYQYVSLWYSNKGWLAGQSEGSNGMYLKGAPATKKDRDDEKG